MYNIPLILFLKYVYMSKYLKQTKLFYFKFKMRGSILPQPSQTVCYKKFTPKGGSKGLIQGQGRHLRFDHFNCFIHKSLLSR